MFDAGLDTRNREVDRRMSVFFNHKKFHPKLADMPRKLWVFLLSSGSFPLLALSNIYFISELIFAGLNLFNTHVHVHFSLI